MSAQTTDIKSYSKTVNDSPSTSPVRNSHEKDDTFSKTFDEIKSRREDRAQETNRRENVQADADKVSKRAEKIRNEKNKHEVSPNEENENDKDEVSEKPLSSETVTVETNEALLANIDFGTLPQTAEMTAAAQTTQAEADTKQAPSTQDGTKNTSTDSTKSSLAKSTVAADIALSTTKITDAIAANVEDASGVQIKASEKVAAAAKENAVVQVQDNSSKAKETALANLQSIEGTDTTVVESETGTDAKNNNSNNSFSQGNASEQLIKLSIQNAQGDKTAQTDSFNIALDKQVQSPNAAQQPKELNKADIFSQINSKLNEMPQQTENNSKVTIILKPENLGRIHLEIVNTHEGIIAKLLTENQQVKELLDKNMEALKSQLGAQGVNVNNIKVENTQHAANNSMDFEREQFNQNGFSNNSQQNQSGETNTSNKYSDDIEFDSDMNIEFEAQKPQTQIIHDGKIDYKV